MSCLYIMSGSELLLSPEEGDRDLALQRMAEGAKGQLLPLSDGYLLVEGSRESGLIFALQVDGEDLDGYVRRELLLSVGLLAAAVVLGAVIVTMSVRRVSAPIRHIAGLVGGTDETTMKDLSDQVGQLVRRQQTYLDQLRIRDGMVKDLMTYSDVRSLHDRGSAMTDLAWEQILSIRIHPDGTGERADRLVQETLESCFSLFTLMSVGNDRYIAYISVLDPEEHGRLVRQAFTQLRDRLGDTCFLMTAGEAVRAETFSDALPGLYRRIGELEDLSPVGRGARLIVDDASLARGGEEHGQELFDRAELMRIARRKDPEPIRRAVEEILAGLETAGAPQTAARHACEEMIAILLNAADVDPQEGDAPGASAELGQSFTELKSCYWLDGYSACMLRLVDLLYRERAAAPEEGEEDPIIRRVRAYVAEHYAQDFPMDALCAEVGLSRGYLSTYFKKITGEGLSDYIRAYRVERAAELLASTDLHVNDIARQVGIPDPNTFNRVFKKYMGCTAGDHKRRLREAAGQTPEDVG